MCSTMKEKWRQIARDVTSGDTTSLSDKGSLVVVGSGIMCVTHFTIEALEHIKDADTVFYLVSDPATEVYIQELKPGAIDLFVLYDEDKDRHETYAQITEVLLYYTRRGQKVVAVFYGHPGYLVNPSREAIRIARLEGLSAFEVPAISSLDTMISELGFEPGIPGLHVLEATDLLMYSRKLLTYCHVVINQIGSVGDVTFHFDGFPNPHFPVLIEYLIGFYGNDHVVYHYVGSQFPVCKSLVERFKLDDLLKPENSASIQSMSTMYLPPLCEGVVNLEIANKIGMITSTRANNQTTKSTKEDKEKLVVKTNFSSKDISVGDSNLGIKGFTGWSVPHHYKPVQSTPLAKYLIDVSQSPQKLREFQTKKHYPSLPEYQAKALRTRNSDWIRFAIKNERSEVEKVMKQRESLKTSSPCVVETNKENQIDGRNKAKPLILASAKAGAMTVGFDKLTVDADGLNQVDGPSNKAKPLINAPRKADALVVGSDRLEMDADGLNQVDGPSNKAKPLINAPRKADALVVGSDRLAMDADGLNQVDGPSNKAKPLINAPRKADALVVGSDRLEMDADGLNQVDGPSNTSKPLINAPRKADALVVGSDRLEMDADGLNQVDGPSNTAKPLINAPRKADALVVGSDRLEMDADGLNQVDGPSNTSKPLINAPRKADALVVGSDRLEMDADGLNQVDGPSNTAKPLTKSRRSDCSI